MTQIKAPGWSRIVAELSAGTPDDRLFLLRLLAILGQVSAARQALLFTVPASSEAGGLPPDPTPVCMWPFSEPPESRGGSMTAEQALAAARVNPGAVEAMQEVKAAATAAATARQTRIFGLDDSEPAMYGEVGKGCVIAVPVAAGSVEESAMLPLRGVVTLLVDGRSRQALQTTLALVEVLAGYAFGASAHAALRRSRGSSAALDLATRLIASMNTAADFKGCALTFVNDLCRQLAVDRVALGWVKGPPPMADPRTRAPATQIRTTVKTVALSDTENLDRRMAMVQKIEAAMEECLDQEQTVVYPQPPADGPGGDVVLSQTVVHAHRELAATDAKLRIASFPLRVGDRNGERTVGVVLLESGGAGAIELPMVELVQAALDLVAPILAVKHSDDRSIALRTWHWLLRTGAWLVGPRHTVWKLAGAACVGLTLFVTLYDTTYRVGAPMELSPRERRIVSAPFEGVIARLEEGAEPGKAVTAEQPLVAMEATELRLRELDARARIVQHEREADEALRKGDTSEATQADARAAQARAEADLYAEQVRRSVVRAPIAGTIIAGDLKDKVGASVKIGDPIFEIADLKEMKVIAKVEDRDIGFISDGEKPTTGQFSPKSDPSRSFNFVVERIVPLAKAAEGANSYEVHCRVTDPYSPVFRPGMQGQAKFDGPEKSLAWIATRRVIDQLRIWLWW